jgi:hypothetical protein
VKNSPMPPRKARLARGTGIARRSPLTAVPRALPAPRYTGPSRKVRLLVLERDGYACVCCGTSIIGRPYSLQHRKRRSQGGDNSPSNLITVLGTGTTGCHERIDSRRDPADEAKGYTVRSFGNPLLVPVMLAGEHGSGITVWLDNSGNCLFEAPEAAA